MPGYFVVVIVVFLVESGFLHVGQAGLKLLTSGDPPALALQSARIIGDSHCTQREHKSCLIHRFPPGLITVLLHSKYSLNT